MRYLHVIAGSLSILAGFVALVTVKGSTWHRRAGDAFVVAMLVMSSTGAVMAALKPNRGSVLAGLLAFHLVATAHVTVWRPLASSRATLASLMALGFATAAFGAYVSWVAWTSVDGKVDQLPFAPMVFFTMTAIAAATLDARLLARGGAITGAPRLVRHLWRMGFAMFLATSSLFLGQAQQFPAWLRDAGVLPLPVLAVIALTIAGLVRVLRRRVAARAQPVARAA